MTTKPKYQVWQCQIGAPYFEVPKSADSPMRAAVCTAFENIMTPGGYHASTLESMFCFSGWNGQLAKQNLAMVENKPLFAEDRQYFISQSDIEKALIKCKTILHLHEKTVARELMKAINENNNRA